MHRSPRVTTGLVLNAVLALASLPFLVVPTLGPAPVVANVVTGVMALVVLAGVALAWRGRVLGVVLVVVMQVLNLLSAVPAFLDDLPAAFKAFVAVATVLTVVAVALVLPALRPARPVAAR